MAECHLPVRLACGTVRLMAALTDRQSLLAWSVQTMRAQSRYPGSHFGITCQGKQG